MVKKRSRLLPRSKEAVVCELQDEIMLLRTKIEDLEDEHDHTLILLEEFWDLASVQTSKTIRR